MAKKNWIKKAAASVKRRGTKGKCGPSCSKPGCTGRALALCRAFHTIARRRKGKKKAEGGYVGLDEMCDFNYAQGGLHNPWVIPRFQDGGGYGFDTNLFSGYGNQGSFGQPSDGMGSNMFNVGLNNNTTWRNTMNPQYAFNVPGMFGSNNNMQGIGERTPFLSGMQGKWGETAMQAAGLISPIMNIGMGLKRREALKNFTNPYLNRSLSAIQQAGTRASSLLAGRKVNIDPQLEDNRRAAAIAQANLRQSGNVSQGQYMSAIPTFQNVRQQQDWKARAFKDLKEADWKTQEAAQAYQTGRDYGTMAYYGGRDQQMMDERSWMTKLGTEAAGRQFLGQGASDIGLWAQYMLREKRLKERDKRLEGLYPDMFQSYMYGYRPKEDRWGFGFKSGS